MNRTTRRLLRSLLFLLVSAAVTTPSAAVEYREKKATPGASFGSNPQSTGQASSARNLDAFYRESGPLSLSVDAIGTALSFGTIEIDKPVDAKLRRAFLVVATGGYGGGEIHDGDVRIEERRVLWDRSIPNVIGGWNALADVTELLRQRIDAALPGRMVVEVTEDHSEFVDGVVLVAVFELTDPSVDHDIALFFGAHGAAGNGFTLMMSKPAPSTVGDWRLELGVGISYSLQTTQNESQYTIIDVNGRRLTASAGGPDDGSPMAGALLTVGGIGDDPANPPDPVATPKNMSSDDELYDITPFVRPGDTKIEVSTANPSKDDNLFFASFFARRNIGPAPMAQAPAPQSPSAFVGPVAPTAVMMSTGAAAANSPGTQIVLSSASSKSGVGSQGEIVATVTGANGLVTGVSVELTIVSGPHAGATSRAYTNASGRATFLYSGVSEGTDVIVATLDDGSGKTVAASNALLYDWVQEVNAYLAIEPGTCPAIVDPRMQDVITVALVGTPHFVVDDVDATSLYLQDAVPIRVQYQDMSSPADGVDCPCSSQGRDGLDDIVMLFRFQDVFAQGGDPSGRQTLKLTGKFKTGSSFEAVNCVLVQRSTSTTTVPGKSNVLVPTEEGFNDR